MVNPLFGSFMSENFATPPTKADADGRDDRFARLLITALGGGLLATSFGRMFEIAILGYGLTWLEVAFGLVGFLAVYRIMRTYKFSR